MSRPQPQLLIALAVLALAIANARPLAPPAAAPHAAFGHGGSIVLVHGLGSLRADWLPTARLLARHHRVTLMDLPGHGEADMPEPFSLERATASLERALARLPEQPVILVGHSLGGLVAARVAIEHPGRVRGLVLIETSLRPQLPDSLRAAALERLEHDYRGVLREAYLDFGRDSIQGERLYRRVAALDPRMVRRWIRLAWTADLSERVRGLRLPVLAVLAERSWGMAEPWNDAAQALGLAEVPRLRAARISGCGHFVMLDRPRELAALIGGFALDPDGQAIAAR